MSANTGDQDPVYLSVRADHKYGAPNVDKIYLFVEGNGSRILFPYAKPNVTTFKLMCGLMDRLYKPGCQIRPVCPAIHVQAVQFNWSGMRYTGRRRAAPNLSVCDELSA